MTSFSPQPDSSAWAFPSCSPKSSSSLPHHKPINCVPSMTPPRSQPEYISPHGQSSGLVLPSLLWDTFLTMGSGRAAHGSCAFVLFPKSVLDQNCPFDWEVVQKNWALSVSLHAAPRLLAFTGRNTPCSQGLSPSTRIFESPGDTGNSNWV